MRTPSLFTQTKTRHASLRPLALMVLISMNSFAGATDGTWLSTSGDGDWSNTGQWVGGTTATGIDGTATLDGTTGRTITLTSPTEIGNLTVANWSSTPWRITGDTLLLTTSSGKPLIDIAGGGGDSLRIDSVIAGTQGFTLTGSGRLYLTGANTFIGGIELDLGILWTANAGTLNGNTLNISGASSTWLIDGTNPTYTNNVVIANDHINLALGNHNQHTTLSGIISESGGSRNLNLVTNGGNAVVALQGSNSYTGDTHIGSGHNYGYVVVRAEHNTALGIGEAAITFTSGGSKTHSDDALELANNVTISDKTITLRGQGRDNGGSLRSVSDNNIWDGNVDTGSVENATIGVDVDQLSINGSISGNALNGLTKTGDGTLLLNGGNTFSNGTIINAGRLLAGHEQALASGSVTIGDSSTLATLSIAEGVNLAVADLTLSASSRLEFYLGDSFTDTQINLSGDQIGSGTYLVDIFDSGIVSGTYTLLTVAGNAQASGFALGALNDNYTLNWDGSSLSLTVIPEPSTTAILGLGAMFAAYFSRKRK